MRILKTKVYPFTELSDEAKKKAIQECCEFNVNYEWWNSDCDNAKNVKLKLTSFDLDGDRHCCGEFIEYADDTANKIIAEHGGNCETSLTALQYIADRKCLVIKYSDGVTTDEVTEDNEYDFNNNLVDLDEEFLRSILEDYSIMLQKQYEYLMSEEAIIETIEANEYEFTEAGELI